MPSCQLQHVGHNKHTRKHLETSSTHKITAPHHSPHPMVCVCMYACMHTHTHRKSLDFHFCFKVTQVCIQVVVTGYNFRHIYEISTSHFNVRTLFLYKVCTFSLFLHHLHSIYLLCALDNQQVPMLGGVGD